MLIKCREILVLLSIMARQRNSNSIRRGNLGTELTQQECTRIVLYGTMLYCNILCYYAIDIQLQRYTTQALVLFCFLRPHGKARKKSHTQKKPPQGKSLAPEVTLEQKGPSPQEGFGPNKALPQVLLQGCCCLSHRRASARVLPCI